MMKTLQSACRVIESLIMEIFAKHGWWSTNRLSFFMNFYSTFYHYASGLILVAAHKPDRVSLVLFFVISWPRVLSTRGRDLFILLMN
jgi:hypothetical protein